RASLAREHGSAILREYDSPRGLFYRVLVGHERDQVGAEELAARLRNGDATPFVVRVDDRL
ncbi:MAG: SPOR domain-containing protein, partial [Acidobacteria bacterium]|nr:SPOR domain-containing protein [Acidobacteriota bacterium]